MSARLAAAVSSLAIIAAAPPAIAQSGSGASQTQAVNIPSGPLVDAILTFSEIYGVPVLAPDELVRGKTASAVSGALSASEALEQLLAGTGLEARSAGNGNFVLAVTTAEKNKDDGGKNTEREVIIVLGQKRVKNYFDVTSSVSVTTGEEIEREPLTDLYDVIDRIPNVNRDTQGDTLGFAIRGIRETGPARAGDGPLITVFVDDAPLNGAGSGLGPTGAWDLEQVEVYRGPQSTNFGRNSLAGAVYLRTKDPSYDWDLKARAEIGNYGQRWGAIAFGGGIIDDKIAFRVAADYRETQGFTFNPLLGSFNDNTELWNTRLKLRFDPADDLSIITTTTYAENLGGPSAIPLPPQVNGELQDPSDQVREAPTDV
ncbi:MAG: TonB-dependent receptor, partial [Pseudomonadota bacterium]